MDRVEKLTVLKCDRLSSESFGNEQNDTFTKHKAMRFRL